MGRIKQKEKDHAKLLFLDTKENLSVTEIAKRVGVRKNTVTDWIRKGDWKKLKRYLLVTRKNTIENYYNQIEWLNTEIKGRENKAATPKEADTLIKLTNAIHKLENEVSIAEVYEVGTEFLNFIKPIDFDTYKKSIDLFDLFINTKLK